MRTTKEIVKEEVKGVEFNLKEAFVLWKNKAKSGVDYLSGYTEDKKVKLVGYFNSNKKNPKEPDIRVYLTIDGKQDMEVAALWESVSEEKGTRYLTGTTNDDEKLVGWYSKVEDEKRPHIRVYYK